MVEPRGDAVMLAEVPGKFHALDPWVPPRQFLDDLPGIIATAIFNQDDLEIIRDLAERRHQAPMEFMQAVHSVIDRADYRYVRHRLGSPDNQMLTTLTPATISAMPINLKGVNSSPNRIWLSNT